MLKITALVLLFFVGTLFAASSCGSCGNECVHACGTRYFRTCCFNYLRKKRGTDDAKFWASLEEDKLQNKAPSNLPVVLLHSVPDFTYSPSDVKSFIDSIDENRLSGNDFY